MADKLKSGRWIFISPYLGRYKMYFIAGMVCVILSTAIDQVGPWMIKIILDGLENGQPFRKLLTPLAMILLAATAGFTLLYFRESG